ncbi:hypothetical protein LBA_00205 [Megavirus lba]|uniref:Endonuclease/exonuclease/phosphatase n=1 Tax=Megavirus lba TaxID=1235314 RepID=L7XXE8_9VIRU|nr:hypothetical protein LBA_00205 [Megavirus lba]
MVKILSYNVFFKTMSIPPVHKKCEMINDISNGVSYTNCLKNISNFIEQNSDCDFVLLQEATNWDILQQITPVLTNMEVVHHKYDLEEIVTFFNKKYILDKTHNTIFGYMSDINRPFQILFFNNNLCVINLHAGHNKDIYDFDKHLIRTLKSNKYHKQFIQKLQTYDIIMGGDFNDNLNDSFRILIDPYFDIEYGRKLYGFNKTPSCCNYNLSMIKQNKTYDHILSTLSDNISEIKTISMASDHMPIIAIIKKHIGYDFDGVLHIDVTKSDDEGQRHPINMTGPYNIFENIVQNILNNILLGNSVYIITARNKTNQNLSVITNHLTKAGLEKYLNNITILFSGGLDKTKLLHKYKINEFYDDSCLRIIELYTSHKKIKLPNLNNLFITYPEKNSYQLINDKNINDICSKNMIQTGGINKFYKQFYDIDINCINKCYNIIVQTIIKSNQYTN